MTSLSADVCQQPSSVYLTVPLVVGVKHIISNIDCIHMNNQELILLVEFQFGGLALVRH